MTSTTNDTNGKAGGRLPPRFIIRGAWILHRAIHRLSGGRLGLRPASDTTWGMMRLKTIGRKSGRERAAILGYYEDGPNLGHRRRRSRPPPPARRRGGAPDT